MPSHMPLASPPRHRAHCSHRGTIPIYCLAGAAQSCSRPDQPLSMTMLNEVYNSRTLELAGNIPRLGRLSAPDASATAHSKLCGSTVKIDLKMDGPVVTDFPHDG